MFLVGTGSEIESDAVELRSVAGIETAFKLGRVCEVDAHDGIADSRTERQIIEIAGHVKRRSAAQRNKIGVGVLRTEIMAEPMPAVVRPRRKKRRSEIVATFLSAFDDQTVDLVRRRRPVRLILINRIRHAEPEIGRKRIGLRLVDVCDFRSDIGNAGAERQVFDEQIFFHKTDVDRHAASDPFFIFRGRRYVGQTAVDELQVAADAHRFVQLRRVTRRQRHIETADGLSGLGATVVRHNLFAHVEEREVDADHTDVFEIHGKGAVVIKQIVQVERRQPLHVHELKIPRTFRCDDEAQRTGIIINRVGIDGVGYTGLAHAVVAGAGWNEKKKHAGFTGLRRQNRRPDRGQRQQLTNIPHHKVLQKIILLYRLKSKTIARVPTHAFVDKRLKTGNVR